MDPVLTHAEPVSVFSGRSCFRLRMFSFESHCQRSTCFHQHKCSHIHRGCCKHSAWCLEDSYPVSFRLKYLQRKHVLWPYSWTKKFSLATFILLFVTISNVGIRKCVRNMNLNFKLQVKAIVTSANFELADWRWKRSGSSSVYIKSGMLSGLGV
jgi:hypothetical protein